MNSSKCRANSFFVAASLGACLALGPILSSEDASAQQTGRYGDTPAEIYAAACSSCHGTDGRGRTASQLGFDLPMPDFTDCNFATREPDLDWLAIAHGGGPTRGFNRKMPSFDAALSDEDLRKAVNQLRTFCADENWPRGDLNFPLPLITEKAFPEDEAVMRTSINAEGSSAFEQKYTYEKRFGPRSQIEVALPLMRADLGDPVGSEGGIGDLVFAFKHAIYHSLQNGSILSLGGEIALPTGDEDRGFGKGTTVVEPYVLFGKALPGNAFLQFQGAVELPVESGFEDEVVLRAALGKTWTTHGPYGRAWTPMIEALGAHEMTGGADTEWDLLPQLQVSLDTRQHILANFGIRVPVNDSSNRDSQIIFYVLWDWFDGGLTEGW